MSVVQPPTTRPAAGSRRARHQPRVLLLAGAVASVVLWYLPGAGVVLYPLRLFVTLVHEGAHALATVLTGGSVDSITIWPSGSGLTMSVGGSPVLVLMAGYLGTALAGAGCLWV